MGIGTLFAQYLNKHRTGVLLACWVMGSGSGLWLATQFDGAALMEAVVCRPMSTDGILVVAVLPFLICSLAVQCSELWILPVYGGAKACAFCYNACAVSVTFGDCGWLIRCLLLFSDLFVIPGLCVFCLRYISGGKALLRREWYIWFLLAVLVGSLDYFVVSPFLVGLFQ